MSKRQVEFMKVKIKPKEGVTVIDPLTNKPMPEGGREVPLNTYWRRRLLDGDVERVQPVKTKKQSKSTKGGVK